MIKKVELLKCVVVGLSIIAVCPLVFSAERAWAARFTAEMGGWQKINADVNVTNGIVRMIPKQSPARLLKKDIKLLPGRSYLLSYEFQGSSETRSRIYLEWVKGGGYYSSNSTQFNPGTGMWERKQFGFSYNGTPSIKPYLAIQCSDGPVEFRNLQLEILPELAADDNLLRNPDGSLGTEFWNSSGGNIKSQNGILSLTPGAKETGKLQQNNIPLIPYEEYILRYACRSKADVKTRVYVEWTVNGSYYSSKTTAFITGNGDWQQREFRFLYNGISSTSPYAVIQSRGGTAEFRNVCLKKVVPETVPSGTTGGEWRLTGNTANTGTEKIPKIQAGAGEAILQNIPITTAGKMRLEFDLEGNGESGTASGYHPFRLSIVAFPGGKIMTSPWDDVLPGSKQRKNFVFEIPSGTKKLECRWRIMTKGTLTVSNPSLTPVVPNPVDCFNVEITSPFYRHTVYSSLPVTTVKGKLRSVAEARGVKVELLNREGTLIASEDKDSFVFEIGLLPYGEYTIRGHWRLHDGSTQTAVATFRKAAPADREVVIGPDRQLYINGKLFWPVIFYQTPGPINHPEAFWREAAANGVNTLLLEKAAGATLDNLDLAARCGLKLMLYIGSIGECGTETEELYVKKLKSLLTDQFVNHPALLGYYIADEPSWGGRPLKPLLRSYELLRTYDPYHPVWMNSAPRGDRDEHQAYSRAADIYGVDIYPVPPPDPHGVLNDKTLNVVGQYARFTSEATNWQKPNWMILQGFAWGVLNNQPPVYPTRSQLRFMVYDALTNGGTAVAFWGQVFIRDPKFYKTLLDITRELQLISGLIPGKIVGGGTAGDKRIQLYAKEVDGRKYLIALNHSAEKLRTKIRFPFEGEDISVLLEDRKLPLRNKAFSDDFDGFGVHLYSESNLPPPLYPLLSWTGQGYANWSDFFRDHNACWIWRKAAFVSGGHCAVGREIIIKKPVETATLVVGVDDSGIAYLNGARLGETGGGRVLRRFKNLDLHQGRNFIAVAARDMGGLPCGVIASIEIKYADGGREIIVSDASWRAAPQYNAVPEQWEPVEIVSPLGKGKWGYLWGSELRIMEW